MFEKKFLYLQSETGSNEKWNAIEYNPLGIGYNPLAIGFNPLGIGYNQLGIWYNPLGIEDNRYDRDKEHI